MKKTMDEPHAIKSRCGAKTRSNIPCKAFSMPNGRCRMHGGMSTGPRTQEGLERSRRANLKHGLYSVQSKRYKQKLNEILKEIGFEIKIHKIKVKLEQRGFTLVPLRIYFNDRGLAKAEIALARGKRQYDKRQKLQREQQKRDVARTLKKYNR